jgi:hypothetical protein
MVYNNPLKYNSRQLKCQLLAKENNSVVRIDDLRYRVKSQSSKGEYDILSEIRKHGNVAVQIIYFVMKNVNIFLQLSFPSH